MKNPYEVLGVSPNCTNEELRSAYRALVKKYHPDNYQDEKLADVAEEKMKEINAAYDEILQIRAGKKTENDGTAGGTSSSTSNNPIYSQIRQAIQAGNFRRASELLNRVRAEEREADWFFLQGCVLLQGGYYFDALRYIDKACQMDPNNQEYQQAREQINRQANGYNQRGNAGGGDSCHCSICDICTAIWCMDCLCGGCGR